MALHRCVVADFLTDRTLTEMDLTVETCERRIIIPGAFRARYPMSNAEEAAKGRKIVAGRTVVHVMHGAGIWGSYVIWYAAPAMDDLGNLTLQLQGSSLESYAYRRKIRADLPFDNVDQIDIARYLLTHMSARPEGDMGLTLMGGTSGFPRDRTYKASESASYGERLEQLANVLGGFEYMIRTGIDPVSGARTREWVWAATLGTPGVTHTITQPGKVKSWSYPSDATQAGNSWQGRGDTDEDDLGTESEPLMGAVFEDTAALEDGHPLLDRTEDYSGVRDPATLDERAEQLAATRSGAVSIPRVLVHFDDDFAIDPNYLGDVAKFTLLNDWFPLTSDGSPTFTKEWRIVGMDLHTPSGDDPETRAELLFEEA